MAQLQITKEYWDAHPEIQAQYKVGDSIEVADIPGAEPPKQGSGSTLLDSLGKEFEGKLTATTRERKLPSGSTATIADFRGKHVFKAQRYLTQNPDDKMSGEDLIPIIISICTLIDGKPITPDDLNEMQGQDVLVLMGEFSAANFS